MASVVVRIDANPPFRQEGVQTIADLFAKLELNTKIFIARVNGLLIENNKLVLKDEDYVSFECRTLTQEQRNAIIDECISACINAGHWQEDLMQALESLKK